MLTTDAPSDSALNGDLVLNSRTLKDMQLGVSVVVCCHNSARRLPQTLRHLSAQVHRGDLPWEVIVIDNASSDDTRHVALECWPKNHPAPLRVIDEPSLGLNHARQRALREARYEIISFVDDDNWVCDEWVQLVSEVMSEHPHVAACGGYSEEVCEIDPPEWFVRHKYNYAVGPDGLAPGGVSGTQGFLWGAGLGIRRSAWIDLKEKGFSPLLVGRAGKSLTAGEDVELCYALRLAGWELWFEPRMRFRHFIPEARLDWQYLRRVHRGFGACSVGTDPYTFLLKGGGETLAARVKRQWQLKLLRALRSFLSHPWKLLASFLSPLEGDAEVLRIEHQIGRTLELLRKRKVYSSSFHALQELFGRKP